MDVAVDEPEEGALRLVQGEHLGLAQPTIEAADNAAQSAVADCVQIAAPAASARQPAARA